MKPAITACNVLGAEAYKKQVADVLEFTGKIVARTIGPCANTSIIEEFGPLSSTKDGFHTLINIKVAPEDTFAKNILTVITKMAQRMVALVGDGSSSATVAAWKFANELGASSLKNKRPRALNELVQTTLENICNIIEKNSIKPTEEDMPEVMYKTALVSSNGDVKFAEMMREIYKEVGSTAMFNIIKDDRTNRTETSYDIVTGYKANHYYMIDPVFFNSEGTFTGTNVHLLCFDMALTQYHHGMIQRMAALAHMSDPDKSRPYEVVVIAPSYDQNLMDMIATDTRMDLQLIQSKQIRHIRIRYARCLAVDQYQRNEFMDFCMMAGAVPITAVDFNKMVSPLEGTEEFDDARLAEAVGHVSQFVTHLNEHITIQGFPKRNEEMFKITFNQVEKVYRDLANENLNAPYPSATYIKQRQRYRKLLCRMVDVMIGAPNEYERSIRYDAADDATKACESVANYGYNVGGNMAILFAIHEMADNTASINKDQEAILNVLHRTFVDVVEEVFANEYTAEGFDSLDEDTRNKIDDIIRKCIEDRTYYDLITGEYTNDIVNSSRTDTEILRGALSISLTLLTANQYLMQIPVIEVGK